MKFWAGQILAAVTDNRPDTQFRLVLVTGDPDATGKLSEIEPTTPDEEGWIKEIDIQMGDDVAANKPIPVDPWGVLYKLAVAIDEDRPGSRRRRCGLPSLPGYGYSGHRFLVESARSPVPRRGFFASGQRFTVRPIGGPKREGPRTLRKPVSVGSSQGPATRHRAVQLHRTPVRYPDSTAPRGRGTPRTGSGGYRPG